MIHAQLYITLAVIFGFFMAWGVGANDVANAMGTSVGSKVFTFKQAMLVAAIFEAIGALLAGGNVTQTIRGQIIDPHMLSGSPELLIFGMLAALLAAGTWLLIATYFGWPVSTTHSIVGAIIGFGIVVLGTHAIYWHETINIALSWVLTPVISGIVAFLLFNSVQKLILQSDNPLRQAKRYVPYYIFLVAFVLSLVTFLEGLQHVGLHLTFVQSIVLSLVISAGVTLIGIIAIYRLPIDETKDRRVHFVNVERMFGVLMVFTACSMAFAHGSNDVANAIGPLAAVVSIVKSAGNISAHSPIPFWIMLLGAIGIILGLATYGLRVIRTVGERITYLTPSRGFAAELATATTVVIASGFGLPVSTTQTLVGAILGVGIARGIDALDLGIVRNILLSWIITLPAGALLAIFYFYTIKIIFM